MGNKNVSQLWNEWKLNENVTNTYPIQPFIGQLDISLQPTWLVNSSVTSVTIQIEKIKHEKIKYTGDTHEK